MRCRTRWEVCQVYEASNRSTTHNMGLYSGGSIYPFPTCSICLPKHYSQAYLSKGISPIATEISESFKQLIVQPKHQTGNFLYQVSFMFARRVDPVLLRNTGFLSMYILPRVYFDLEIDGVYLNHSDIEI